MTLQAQITDVVAAIGADIKAQRQLVEAIVTTPGPPGPMGSLLGVVLVADTTRSLTQADDGYVLYCTAGTAITITTAAGIAAGFSCMIVQAGAGQITVAQGAGTTLSAYEAMLKSAGQYATLTLFTPVADTFILAGQAA